MSWEVLERGNFCGVEVSCKRTSSRSVQPETALPVFFDMVA